MMEMTWLINLRDADKFAQFPERQLFQESCEIGVYVA